MRTYEVARMTTGGCSEREVQSITNVEESTDNSIHAVNSNHQESEMVEMEAEMDENPRKRLRSSGSTSSNTCSREIEIKIMHTSGSTGKLIKNGPDQFSKSNAEITQMRKEIDTLMEKLQTKNDERLVKVLKQHEAKWAEKIEQLEKQNSELKKLLRDSWASVNKATKAAEELKSDLESTSKSLEKFVSNCS